MKPEYSNYFVVRKNSINTEVIVDFFHYYEEIDLSIGETKVELSLKSNIQTDKISSIVMNINDAITLRNILDKVLSETNIHEVNKNQGNQHIN